MSLKEKNIIKILFAIDNNLYLISNNQIKKSLIRIKRKYQKYVIYNDVMKLNIYKIRMSFINEFFYKKENKEKRGLNNIVNVFNEILDNKTDDKLYEDIENDLNIINYYLLDE